MISKRPEIELTPDDIEHLFTYHAPRGDQLPAFEAINLATQNFARTIEANIEKSADRTNAVRALQRLRMECNLAVALTQPPPEPEPDPVEETDIDF